MRSAADGTRSLDDLAAALDEAEARYASLVQRAGYGLYRSSADGRFLEVNSTLAAMLGGSAYAQDTVKIGYIDPLSGGGASIGEGGLKTFQYLADELNAKGGILGHKVEIVPMDNKVNPQESLVQAQKAVDAGIHYITQGNGSAVAAALEDFVN